MRSSSILRPRPLRAFRSPGPLKLWRCVCTQVYTTGPEGIHNRGFIIIKYGYRTVFAEKAGKARYTVRIVMYAPTSQHVQIFFFFLRVNIMTVTRELWDNWLRDDDNDEISRGPNNFRIAGDSAAPGRNVQNTACARRGWRSKREAVVVFFLFSLVINWIAKTFESPKKSPVYRITNSVTCIPDFEEISQDIITTN